MPDPAAGTGTPRFVREQHQAQIPWSGDTAKKTQAHRKSGAAASGTQSGPATLVPVAVPIRVRPRGPGACRTFAWKDGGTPYGRAPGLQRIGVQERCACGRRLRGTRSSTSVDPVHPL